MRLQYPLETQITSRGTLIPPWGTQEHPHTHTRHTSNTLGTLLVPPQCTSVHSSIPCGPQYSFTALQYTFEAHPVLPGYLKDPPCSPYNASRDPRSPLHPPITLPHTNRRCSCPLRQHRRSCGAWSPWATTGCSCGARGWSRPPCPSRPPSTPVSWAPLRVGCWGQGDPQVPGCLTGGHIWVPRPPGWRVLEVSRYLDVLAVGWEGNTLSLGP